MEQIPAAELERVMRVQDVILRATAKKITWWQAAEILGVSVRTMRRWKANYEKHGLRMLVDGRKGKRNWRKVEAAEVEKVLTLYRERYHDLNMTHFHEKLVKDHDIRYSYTWLRSVLEGSGLVSRQRSRTKHRKRRPRKPLPGMMLHIDGSHHQWFQDDRWYDLILILDDATSTVCYAQLAEAEGTRSVMAGLRDVVERHGWFASVYSDRASHFFHTPKGGGPVDFRQLSQVGRAMKDLGIRMIPAYSPQARGRSERSFGTWQGRLPPELRLRGITALEEANRFLRESYIDEFNARFARPASGSGTAFVPLERDDLDRIFSIQHERVVRNDNTVQLGGRVLQIEPTPIRASMAGLSVIIYEHLDGTVSIGYGPHILARWGADGSAVDLSEPVPRPRRQRIERRSPRRSKRSALRTTLSSAGTAAAMKTRKKPKSRR